MKGKPESKKTIPKTKRNYTSLLIVSGICILTFLCFWNTLSNQFLYWDDNAFILNNVNIRRLNWFNIKYLFSHEFGANWQPLTMLSYSINYYFSKYSPGGYFFTNVIIHIANTCLVFFFVKKLMELFNKPIASIQNSKFNNLSRSNFGIQNFVIPSLVALWFGIHPMHVESVAWLFERKDVLYTFFYLAGLIAYLEYVIPQTPKGALNSAMSTSPFRGLGGMNVGRYAITFLLFCLSCMSKPMAVVFPFSLLCIDFLLKRKFNLYQLLEKVPFLIVSLIMGIYTIHTQKEAHAFAYTFSLIDRFFIASYSFLAYIGKLFLPFHLSGFYPYPMNPGEKIPSYFYLMPLLVLLIVAVPVYLAYKKNKTVFRIIVFGFAFYLVNIALVLQFFSVGSAIISDRYSYISYIGLFFMLAYGADYFFKSNSIVAKNIVVVLLATFTIGWAYLCYQRTLSWSNTEAMLGDVIDKYPERVPQAYKYLGIYYGKIGEPEKAFNCYDVLINKMHLRDADAYCNMGTVYMQENKDSMAMRYFAASLQIDSNGFMPYCNLGYIFAKHGDFTTAFRYFDKADKIYPYDEGLYNNRFNAHVAMKDFDDAIKDDEILLHLNPDNSLYYFNRGVAEYSMGNKDAAEQDFLKTYSMQPLKGNEQYHLNANAAYNLSVIYKEKGDEQKSSFYDGEARKLGLK